jgi:hypothetical protein
MNHGDYTGWRKSSYSSGTGNCVEVAVRTGTQAPASVAVRDTKQHGHGPVLEFTSAQWTAFVHAAKGGHFNH